MNTVTLAGFCEDCPERKHLRIRMLTRLRTAAIVGATAGHKQWSQRVFQVSIYVKKSDQVGNPVY